HLYSWGYMEEDPDQPRFFAYLSLFTFAMLMLVTANNLVQMFFGWEGVGLASYLLIGFWYKKPTANAAAIKAFVVNRVGDLGFMLGIFGVFWLFGTVSIPEILAAAPDKVGSSIGFLGFRVDTMSLLCILLFIGAMGKSAQLGLHTWLPDAMEGPTPVSALIHAATMVTAGVFMVCRLSPLFETSQFALDVVTIVGATTAIFAATVGLVQTDIKRVIAYSTCSQLGYMFFAAGTGAYGAAMFHLFTHAFFKALLFLGAGSVIHAMHHEQDMRYYGGLRKHIPLTFWAMMAGTLAITGVGIVGVGGFAGFYSKDAIIEAAFASHSTFHMYAFGIGVLAALLTSFYSWRLMFLTFFGTPRWAQSEHIQHAMHDHDEHAHDHAHDAHGDGTAGYHAHESPLPMLIPLGVLTLGAVFAGFVFHGGFIEAETGKAFWANSTLFFNEHLMHAMHEVPLWVKLSSTVAMLTGLLVAYVMYQQSKDAPQRLATAFAPLYRFFMNKWYFDELYNAVFVRPAFWLGRLFWKQGDIGVIDRFGPNGSAAVVSFGSKLAVKMQSGYLYTYALVMLLGLVTAVSWMMVRT
ncbi:NADH-quinone oxidoreductase subunit L, partial [Sphingorhabdus sp.]|uniref:NADH-quinone oxidoreductase subunit L n=1 Tax=Sphingorhabdus sp. TaxID=1902408 RepID=UPI003783E18F